MSRVGGGNNNTNRFNNINTSGVGGVNNINTTTTTNDLGNGNTFETHTGNDVNAGNDFTPFNEGIHHELGNTANRLGDNETRFDWGRYGGIKNIHVDGRAMNDQNSGNTNWNNRVDWKGSSDRTTEGLGVTRGNRLDTRNDNNTTLFSGLHMVDASTGVQAGVRGKTTGRYGSAEGSARVYSEVGAKALANYSLTNKGVNMGALAEARVVAAGAEVSGKVSTPSTTIGGQQVNLNADVFGRATVEANAGVGANVAIEPGEGKAIISGKAGAFAGAKAYGRARFGIGDLLKVGVYGEGWAGAGAEASGTIGFEDGKFKFGASAGAGLGLGGKVGFRVEVDVVKAGKMAKELADRDKDGRLTLNDAATGVNQVADAAMTGVEKGVDKTLNAIDADGDGKFSRRDLGLHASRLQQKLHSTLDVNGDGRLGLNDIGAGARATGQAIGRGLDATGRAIGRGLDATGQAIGRGARALHNAADLSGDGKLGLDDVGIAAQKTGQAIGRGLDVTGRAIGRGLDATGRAIGRGAQALHNAADLSGDGKLGLDDVGIAAQRTGQAIGRGLDATGKAIGRGARAVHRAADMSGDGKLGLDDVGIAARRTGQAINRGAKAVHRAADLSGDGKLGLDDVGIAAQKTGQAINRGAQATGRAIASGARTVGRTASKVGREIGRQATQAAKTLSDGASRTYNRAKATVGRVASFFGW